jgi:hypothetical protein
MFFLFIVMCISLVPILFMFVCVLFVYNVLCVLCVCGLLNVESTLDIDAFELLDSYVNEFHIIECNYLVVEELKNSILLKCCKLRCN